MAKEKRKDYPNIEYLPSGSCRIRKQVKGTMIRITADTPEEAYAKYFQEKAKVDSGEQKPKTKVLTLGEAMDAYIEKRAVGRSPATLRGYDTIRKNAFPDLMDTDITKITVKEWQDAADAETLSGKSPKTVKNRLDFARSVLKEYGITMPELSLPDAKKSKDDSEGNIRFLDDADVEKFCREIYGGKYELECYMALNGLRCSEILGMEWDRFDLNTDHFTVIGSVVPDRSHKLTHKDSNKNRTSKRTVPILYPRIKELVQEQAGTKPCCKFTPWRLYEWINVRCRRLGITEVGIHGLRHTGASLCVYKEVKRTAILRWFGWSTSDTLDKIYLHMSDRQKDLEAEKMLSFTGSFAKNK